MILKNENIYIYIFCGGKISVSNETTTFHLDAIRINTINDRINKKERKINVFCNNNSEDKEDNKLTKIL